MSTLLSFEMTGGSYLALGQAGLQVPSDFADLVCKSMGKLMVVRYLKAKFYFFHLEHCMADSGLSVLGLVMFIEKWVDVWQFCDPVAFWVKKGPFWVKMTKLAVWARFWADKWQ